MWFELACNPYCGNSRLNTGRVSESEYSLGCCRSEWSSGPLYPTQRIMGMQKARCSTSAKALSGITFCHARKSLSNIVFCPSPMSGIPTRIFVSNNLSARIRVEIFTARILICPLTSRRIGTNHSRSPIALAWFFLSTSFSLSPVNAKVC